LAISPETATATKCAVGKQRKAAHTLVGPHTAPRRFTWSAELGGGEYVI
jgi:hypothetical protein